MRVEVATERAPKVSVLMSVFNGERYLREAVDSILNQTFKDFEFVIVDDGSTDGTSKILASHSDTRIRVIRNEQNMGLTRSLNKGLGLCRGEYVARMDADDVSLPERLERQVAYLDEFGDVGVVGTRMEIIDESGAALKVSDAWCSHDMIAWRLLFGNSMAHSSVLMRKAVIESVGNYNEDYSASQDYDLWTRAAVHTRLANLAQPLVRYRVHDEAISRRDGGAQEACALLARTEFWRRLGLAADSAEALRRIDESQRPGSVLEEGQIRGVVTSLILAHETMTKQGVIQHSDKDVLDDLCRMVTAASRCTRQCTESVLRSEVERFYWRCVWPWRFGRIREWIARLFVWSNGSKT